MSLDTALPIPARTLTLKERTRKDLYSYLSPKLDRVVEVIEPLRALDFFTRQRGGRERYWLLVPDVESCEPGSPRRMLCLEASPDSTRCLAFTKRNLGTGEPCLEDAHEH